MINDHGHDGAGDDNGAAGDDDDQFHHPLRGHHDHHQPLHHDHYHHPLHGHHDDDHHPELLTVSGSNMVEIHPAVRPTSTPATQLFVFFF